MTTLLKSGMNWTMALCFMLQLAVNPVISVVYSGPSKDTTADVSEKADSDSGGSESSPNYD